MLPFEHAVETLVKKIKSQAGFHVEIIPVFITGIILLFIALALMTRGTLSAFEIAFFLSPLWLPYFTVRVAWTQYLALIRSNFIHDQKYILLEIIPPRVVDKSPLAMETVLAGLHFDSSEANWYKKYVQGGLRPYWSLELASIGGEVHFFVWTRASFRRNIETHVYAQYPGAQVVEAPDYTRMITADTKEWDIFACDYKHANPDPYPIKTYVDYALDQPVKKEHEYVDPLANVIEFLGSFGKNEQFWLQFIIRVHKGEKFGKKTKSGKAYTWVDEAKEEIENIREQARFPSTFTDPVTGEMRETPGFPLQTKGQNEMIAAIERNIAKLGFDVGIRAVYLAKNNSFDGAVIPGMKALFNQFNSKAYNEINWNGSRGLLKFEDYPWEINVQARKNKVRRKWVDAFRRRQFFFPPYAHKDYVVMSTEEIATLYHIPSRAVATPGLPRITSATGESPANLPT